MSVMQRLRFRPHASVINLSHIFCTLFVNVAIEPTGDAVLQVTVQ